MITRSRMSSTSQLNAPGLSSATTDMALPNDTPEWGVQLFHMLKNSFTATSNETSQRIQHLTNTTNSISQRITDLCNEVKTSVDAANAKADRALQLIETYADQNAKLTSQVSYLSDALKFVLSEQQRHETHILKNESYSRRENLVFRGFPHNDHEPCDVKVRRVLTTMGIEGADTIPISRCHYLKDRKEIIVRFERSSDRTYVWSKRFALKNSSFYVSEDFPHAIEAQRRQLYPILKAAKAIPQYQRKVTVRENRLVVDDKSYFCDTLHKLPANLDPRKLAEKSSGNVCVFGGSTSRYHELSNYYHRDFTYEHRKYNTVEQAYQHKKARIAGDQNKQREIIFTTNPAIQKTLGRKISGLDLAQWDTDKYNIMKEILVSKFTQHDDLKSVLLNTGDRILAEANRNDNDFGIGMSLNHPDVLDQRKWTRNSNKLGEILINIRAELR